MTHFGHIWPLSVFLTIGYNIAMKVLYKLFERWQKTCHSLHSSLLLSALDALDEPLEEFCEKLCFFNMSFPNGLQLPERKLHIALALCQREPQGEC